MLEIKNLHVNVDGREILKGLDLELPKGQVHAIMGTDLENNLAALHRDDFHVDLDHHAGRGRSQM